MGLSGVFLMLVSFGVLARTMRTQAIATCSASASISCFRGRVARASGRISGSIMAPVTQVESDVARHVDEFAAADAVVDQPRELLGERIAVLQSGFVERGFAGFGDQGVGQPGLARGAPYERRHGVMHPRGGVAFGIDDPGGDFGLALRYFRQHLHAQIDLGIEVAIDRAGRETGAACNHGYLRRGPSALGDQVARGLDDALERVLDLLPPYLRLRHVNPGFEYDEL